MRATIAFARLRRDRPADNPATDRVGYGFEFAHSHPLA
jgi:hypothetical protein